MSLVDVGTAELEELARRVERAELECPLSPDLPSLAVLATRAPLLFGHGRDSTLALITSVLAERQTPRPLLELVWTGPDAKATMSRDTAIVVAEMFASAERTALVAGYAFDHGADILQPLHEAMRTRGVDVDMFLDIERAQSAEAVDDHVMRHLDGFLQRNWPFGSPVPRLYYDPRTVWGNTFASIHAKCIVVDERLSFVGSANFTGRGQERNVEVGVRIDDAAFAKRLVHQWRQTAQSGGFVRGR